MGEFNAKHTDWGCPKNDRRGEILTVLIDAMGLVIYNRGNASTFNRGIIIDLKIATLRTAQKTSKWKVLDEESLRDHFYLSFNIDSGSPTRETPRATRIDIQRLTTSLDPQKYHPIFDDTDAEQKTLSLTKTIHA
jgi:hypothetical protein